MGQPASRHPEQDSRIARLGSGTGQAAPALYNSLRSGLRCPAATCRTSPLLAKTLPDCEFRKRFTILNDTVPDPRNAILVALMHSWNGIKLPLPPEEIHEKLERIETIAKVDLIGRSVASAENTRSSLPTRLADRRQAAGVNGRYRAFWDESRIACAGKPCTGF